MLSMRQVGSMKGSHIQMPLYSKRSFADVSGSKHCLFERNDSIDSKHDSQSPHALPTLISNSFHNPIR